MDFGIINSLIAIDYTSTNHPVSTYSDAAQHLAGKSLFCKIDCSQVYHCFYMVNKRSVGLLGFNFASRTFAYRGLAQCLSRSVFSLPSFVSEYLDPVIKVDRCAQYVIVFRFGANSATDLTRNTRAVIKRVQQAVLKLTIEECHFGVKQVEMLGRTFSQQRISLQDRKTHKFHDKVRFLMSKKNLQRYGDS